MTVVSTTARLRPYDRDALRAQWQGARPFPFFALDGLLDPAFAREVAAAYPTFEQAREMGKMFTSVNERLKLQVTDAKKFAEPVQRLHEALASRAFLDDLVHITGIQGLLADPNLDGGGMHLTGPGGRLDVHVDFNLLGEGERRLFRRLNILVYLNDPWPAEWGGQLELWNPGVTSCAHSFVPLMNRCVVFETSETSYHGVQPMTAPPGIARKSFAAYYYTKDPPAGWDGRAHSTLFKARPEEKLKGWVAMPLERAKWKLRDAWQSLKNVLKRLLGR